MSFDEELTEQLTEVVQRYPRLEPQNVVADLIACDIHGLDVKKQIDMYIKRYERFINDLKNIRRCIK